MDDPGLSSSSSASTAATVLWRAATKPTLPAFDTAAAWAGVDGPPPSGAPTIGVSQEPVTPRTLFTRSRTHSLCSCYVLERAAAARSPTRVASGRMTPAAS